MSITDLLTGTRADTRSKPYALPPEPPVPMAVQTAFWIQRPTELMQLLSRRYGSAFTLALAPFRIALFSDPESIRTIFAAKPDEMHAGEVNRILRVLVGQHSVLLLDGQEHLRHRKLLMPSFHGERMRFYGETMAAITRDVMASWPEGEAITLHEHTQEITLQVILRTVFGADAGPEEQKLGDQIKHMLSAAESRLSIMPMVFLADRHHLEDKPPFKWLLSRRNAVDKTIFEQIARRRTDPALSTRQDVLSLLMGAHDDEGNGMTDVELRDELMTALAAGHETTATGLAWAFERLLSNPATYDRLRDEVRTLGDSPDPEKLAALPYLDAVVKEVLRLRPVVPVVGRVLKKDTRLGGYDMRAGQAVGACIYLAHRNPNVYPEPERFKPERWLGVTPDPTTWLPFGGGIRRCVGAAFALYEMKIVMGTMLATRDFELAQPKDARVRRRAITFWPEGGTRLRTRKRVTQKRG